LNTPERQLREPSHSQAEELLGFIPANDRDTWLSVGMALKHELGDGAFELYDYWSQLSPDKYKGQSVRDVWKSFNGTGRSWGTLVYLARQHGWNGKQCKPRATANSNPARPPEPLCDTSAYAKGLYLAANHDDWLVMAHPYAVIKGLESAGGARRGKASGRLVGKHADCLIVPISNIETDKVRGVECINGQGVKQTFGKKSGGALILGNSLQKKDPWYILEGWASTYSTVFHHNKHTAVCSFGKGSQDSVAHEINRIYNPDEVIILREVD
jgi:putative DNA primase/helicase